MSKKANALVLLLIVATALAAIAIYTTSRFPGEDVISLSIDDAESEISLILDDAITKGLIDFLGYGFSYYSPEPGAMKGTPGWYCTDPVPPDQDEAASALSAHVMDHVRMAIEKFNAEYPDITVEGPSSVEVQGAPDIMSLPDDSIKITLKDVKLSGRDEQGDTIEKQDDIVFERDYKVWNIFKLMHRWMETDLDGLSKRVYDLVNNQECKWRMCSCGNKVLEDFYQDDLLDRQEILDEIEKSYQKLVDLAQGSGIECSYRIVNERIDDVFEYESEQLSPFAGLYTINPHKPIWQDQKALCAIGPYDGPCTLPESEEPIPDDMSADPDRGSETMGLMLDPAVCPEGSRGYDAFYACPQTTGVPGKLDARPRLYTASQQFSTVFKYDDDPGKDRIIVSGPRIDRLGIHKTAAVLFSVTCNSSKDMFMTSEGEKALSSNVLASVSWHKSCPPPGKADASRKMCASGECEVGGNVVMAGAEWYEIFGKECRNDADCSGAFTGPGGRGPDNCFFCDYDRRDDGSFKTTKSCKVKTDKIPSGPCMVCSHGKMVPIEDDPNGPESFACGDGGCKACIGGECKYDPAVNNNDHAPCGNGCEWCEAGECVANPNREGAKCSLCTQCDALGNCNVAFDDPACSGTTACQQKLGCSGTTCQIQSINDGAACGTEANPCGADYQKTCNNGKCTYTGSKDECCGTSICTGEEECVKSRCVSKGTSVS